MGEQTEFELRHWDGCPESDEDADYDADEDRNECSHEGLDCETEEVCSVGCDCGCAQRTLDEVTESHQVSFRRNIREVVDGKYSVVKLNETEDGSYGTQYNVRDEFIEELYKAVGISDEHSG